MLLFIHRHKPLKNKEHKMKLKWNGTIELNGSTLDTSEINFNKVSGPVVIKLLPKVAKGQNGQNKAIIGDDTQYKIQVKAWMTRPTEPDSNFTFMADRNNNIPMPMRTMVGVKLEETQGLVKMRLHGDITDKITLNCMKCGRPITNKVSQYFGMGPECGGHNYVSPFDTDSELQIAVSAYKKQLRKITWEGWIIKSAIIEAVKL